MIRVKAGGGNFVAKMKATNEQSKSKDLRIKNYSPMMKVTIRPRPASSLTSDYCLKFSIFNPFLRILPHPEPLFSHCLV